MSWIHAIPKEGDTWKGKCEFMEWKCSTLQEEVKIQDSHTTPTAWVTKLEYALNLAEKLYQDASDVIDEKTRQAEEHWKTLLK